MPFYINISWMYFCISIGALLVTYIVMYLLTTQFYTQHVFVRKFSMLDLEFPATALELATFINGIYLLPPDLSKQSLHAVKNHLYFSFISLPLAFISIFLFSMQVSMKMNSVGHVLFAIIAWLQIIPFICGIISSIYLLKKISPVLNVSNPSVYKKYQLAETLKWSIALVSTVSAASAMIYFFLIGAYSTISIQYLIIIILEFAIFLPLLQLIKTIKGKPVKA